MVTHGLKNSAPREFPATPPKFGHRGHVTQAPTQAVDQSHLSGTVNPYQGMASQAVTVKVDGWRKGPNDCLEKILHNQGYSQEEIYRQDEHGRSLLDRVSQVNNLKDPNLLAPNRKLVVPSKHQPRKFKSADTRKGAELLMHGPKARPAPKARPVAAAPAQVQPTPPKVQADPATINSARQAASVEVGLLSEGVKDKKFTRDEFRALNSTANQFTELRARYAKAGFTPQRTAQMAQVQQQYGQMYARFLADDKAKIRFAGEKDKSPAAQFHAAQNREGGQIYDQFVAGQIDESGLQSRLMDQRESASVRGLEVTDPVKRRGFFCRLFHKNHKEQ